MMNHHSSDVAERRRAGNQPRQAIRRPVILMTPDILETTDDGTEREYLVRANYAEAIAEAGGIPLILPYERLAISAAVEIADGILITGARPGADIAANRSKFERELISEALEVGKPLLGICHGMQLLGECLGGTFVTDLPDLGETATAHMPRDIPDRLAHEVLIEPESSFARWLGDTQARVNSLHRHALTGSGRFRVTARAPDGVIEAFEGETIGFSLGVQWHPEYRLTPFDKHILKSFVDSAASGLHGRTEQLSSSKPSVRERLSNLGFTLPEPSVPPGSFKGAVRSGRVVTVSGQVPLKGGAVVKTGHLGEDVSIEEGQDCARWALLNALAQLESVAGGFERIGGFVRLAGYIAASPDFTRHGAVLDGASELLRELFPDRWAHARIAVGVSSLPRGVPVEIELIAVLTDDI